jgi:Patatin-like phospholipase
MSDNTNTPPEDPQRMSAVPLRQVLEDERKAIEEIRARRNGGTKPDFSCQREFAKPCASPRQAETTEERCEQTGATEGKTAAAEFEESKRQEESKWKDTIAAAHKQSYVGLALSGGGIRSATFNLGVLQALAELNLLQRVDYLSTVSGGGYIGSWLAAWTYRVEKFATIQSRLALNRANQIEDKEPPPIRFLRVFSNYLTPKVGILSGDTWTLIAVYLRNMLLNQAIVVAMVAALLLLPQFAVRVVIWERQFSTSSTLGSLILGILPLAVLFYTLIVISNNLDFMDQRKSAHWKRTRPAWILGAVAAPLFFVAIVGGAWLRGHEVPKGPGAAAGAALYLGIWVGAMAFGWLYQKWEQWKDQRAGKAASDSEKEKQPFDLRECFSTLAGAVASGAMGGWLYALLSHWAVHSHWTTNADLTFGAPLVQLIFLIATTLHIGLLGISLPDRRREWWGRLGGWLMLMAILWLLIFVIALYFPKFVDGCNCLPAWLEKARAYIRAKYLTPAWILTTIGGILSAKSTSSGKPDSQSWRDIFAKIAPYVFVAGLFCWVSWGIYEIQTSSAGKSLLSRDWGSLHTSWSSVNLISAGFSHGVYLMAEHMGTHRLEWAIGLCAAFVFLMAWRVDINQFSMHLFYRNRLVRCYLGASNKCREPNQFTGFDRTDDLPLRDLDPDESKSYDGPYPILNASLNLVKGKDLAWQERKAESFVMTPKYCGYDVWLEEQDSPMISGPRWGNAPRRDASGKSSKLERFGYRPTKYYAYPASPKYAGHGFNLGTAMGISGAAASPNMGFYSSAPVAFLMTVFNVRLGQWSGNTRHHRGWLRSSPGWGISYMVKELTGGTDDEAKYVYLSDGGHFENLAVYELVKRRCGLIVVCDAEADENFQFAGLGNAIRKCRIDLGINIDLNVDAIRPVEPSGFSPMHCAIGDIHYEMADENAPVGKIIYFKASLKETDSTDLKNYKKNHPTFPHETTANQWFTESQFESYRQLGVDVVLSSVFEPVPPPPTALADALTKICKGGATGEAAPAAAVKPKVSPETFAATTQEANEKFKKIFEDFTFDLSKVTSPKPKANP